MATRSTAALLGLMLGAAACGSGSGPVVTSTPTGRDVPAPTRDSPPATRDSTSVSCVVCDVSYDCVSPRGTGPNGLELRTGDGTCSDTLINLLCSGAPFGAASCSGGGGGPFTCGDTTCSPSQQNAPVSGSAAGGAPNGGGTPSSAGGFSSPGSASADGG